MPTMAARATTSWSAKAVSTSARVAMTPSPAGRATPPFISVRSSPAPTGSLAADTLTNVEVIAALAVHSYDITTNDGNVAAGGTLKLYGSTLGAGDSFTVDGSAETDGKLMMYGGLGSDHFTGGAGDEGFYFGRDGRFDIATDHVDGGGGSNDQLALAGGYSVTISNSVVTNVEVLALLDGLATHSQYHITLTDDWTTAAQTLTVYGATVRDGFTLAASAESFGFF